MDTITSIINSIPEPLATAILTATFTGIVIFFLQKRIENSFAQNLEKFKADLQKSSIEYQVRFSKSYPKTLETIETINQKIISLQQLLINLPYKSSDNESDDEFNNKKQEIRSKIGDFYSFVIYNRFYLLPKMAQDVIDIADRLNELSTILMECRNYWDMSMARFAFFLSLLSRFEKLRLDKIDPLSRWAATQYTEEVYDELKKLVGQLENYYQLVAYTKIDEA